MDLGALLRNFFAATSGSPKRARRKGERRIGRLASGLDQAENGQNETLISRCETKRFAGQA
jgi:hypothetical protein